MARCAHAEVIQILLLESAVLHIENGHKSGTITCRTSACIAIVSSLPGVELRQVKPKDEHRSTTLILVIFT